MKVANGKWMPIASSKIVNDDLNVTTATASEVLLSTEMEQQLRCDWFTKFDSVFSNTEFKHHTFEYLMKKTDHQVVVYPFDYDDLGKTREVVDTEEEEAKTKV